MVGIWNVAAFLHRWSRKHALLPRFQIWVFGQFHTSPTAKSDPAPVRDIRLRIDGNGLAYDFKAWSAVKTFQFDGCHEGCVRLCICYQQDTLTLHL